jgi:hypothetical protein
MTFKVYKSQLAGVDFPEVVEEHRQALLAHRFTGDMAPHAHHMIEAAVRRVPQGEGKPDDFVSDFEVIDDTPPPPSIDDRRNDLLSLMRSAEAAASRAVVGNGKLRLLVLDATAAMAKPEDERTPADLAALQSYHSVMARRAAIERHGAMLEAAIEELPADQVAAYKFEAFPS